MSGGVSPVLARKLLAAGLRELRAAADLTLDRVAAELMVSTSKLSRLEKAQGLPQLRDVRDLIGLYGLTGAERGKELMGWAEAGRLKGWWEEYPDVLAPAANRDEYTALENDATVNRAYTSLVIHGLLQNDDYIRALQTSYGHNQHWTERVIEARGVRRRNLDSRESRRALDLRVVLHEACLRQLVGPPEVRRSQLAHLLEQSERPNVDLRVLRFDAAPHVAATTMWQHFSFEDYDHDVAVLEFPSGFSFIEESDRAEQYRSWFGQLQDRSLDPTRTRTFIHEQLSAG